MMRSLFRTSCNENPGYLVTTDMPRLSPKACLSPKAPPRCA